jgi:hypothetical protein
MRYTIIPLHSEPLLQIMFVIVNVCQSEVYVLIQETMIISSDY